SSERRSANCFKAGLATAAHPDGGVFGMREVSAYTRFRVDVIQDLAKGQRSGVGETTCGHNWRVSKILDSLVFTRRRVGKPRSALLILSAAASMAGMWFLFS